MSPAQTVLITGATGYLGSHLACAWARAGHRVAILKRRSSKLDRLASVLDQIRCFDIEDGVETPFRACSHIDAVVHTATCYGRGDETPLQVFEANTAFPLRLLEAATLFDTETFLNTDTFFNTDTILYKYLSAYALSKNHFAEWGQSYGDAGRIRFLNVRLEHMYGAGDHASKFTTHIIKSCLANVRELDLTAGEQKRDFIYIDDVYSAYSILLDAHGSLSEGHIAFGLGSGQAVRIRDFVELAHRLSCSRTQLKFGALPYRAGEIMESAADISALERLGWRPAHTLEQGLSRFIDAEKLAVDYTRTSA